MDAVRPWSILVFLALAYWAVFRHQHAIRRGGGKFNIPACLGVPLLLTFLTVWLC